jgi:hypothetical protein
MHSITSKLIAKISFVSEVTTAYSYLSQTFVQNMWCLLRRIQNPTERLLSSLRSSVRLSVRVIYKPTKHLLSSLCLPICLYAWSNLKTVEPIFVKFDVGIYRYIPVFNWTRITDTLHEHLPAFLHVSTRIFIAVKNVSNRHCREIAHTFYTKHSSRECYGFQDKQIRIITLFPYFLICLFNY